MESRIRGALGALLVSIFTVSLLNPAIAGRPDFEKSKPGNVNCNGKALGHDSNSPRGKAYGRGDDCDRVENTAPVADAGPDQDVLAGDPVVLDGSGSSDADGDTLSYEWAQVSGEPVTLSSPTAIMPEFTAPELVDGGELVFELHIDDGNGGSDTDTVAVNVAEGRAPTGNITNGDTLGIRETIVIEFSESMEPASLVVGGDFADYSPQATWTQRNEANDTLEIAAAWAWEAGDRTLHIEATDVHGNALTPLDAVFDVDLSFENFQAAELVLGQPDFTSQDVSSSAAWTTLATPYGNPSYSRELDLLYVPDMRGPGVYGFHGIPTVNGPTADFTINGRLYGEKVWMPRTTQVVDNKLVVAEHRARITIFEPLPQSSPATIGAVVGQDDKESRVTGCAANRLSYSFGSWVTPDGRLLAIDRDNHRVLVWNRLPETDGVAADLVLGQQDFVNCAANDQDGDGNSDGTAANTMELPRGVWSDGDKLVVADNGNRRLLIWNEFPTRNGEPADIVIGQDTLSENVRRPVVDARFDGTFALTMWSDGDQLIISDARLNRVLVWNSFPTSNNQPADVVLGQSDFTMTAPDDLDQDGNQDSQPSRRTFDLPTNVAVAGDRLFVSDLRNNRILIFRSR